MHVRQVRLDGVVGAHRHAHEETPHGVNRQVNEQRAIVGGDIAVLWSEQQPQPDTHQHPDDTEHCHMEHLVQLHGDGRPEKALRVRIQHLLGNGDVTLQAAALCQRLARSLRLRVGPALQIFPGAILLASVGRSSKSSTESSLPFMMNPPLSPLPDMTSGRLATRRQRLEERAVPLLSVRQTTSAGGEKRVGSQGRRRWGRGKKK
eukprot:ctg_177.g85